MIQALLAEAKRAEKKSKSWIEFDAMLFREKTGLLSKAFPVHADLIRFMNSPDYAEIHKLLVKSINRHGLLQSGNTQLTQPSINGHVKRAKKSA